MASVGNNAGVPQGNPTNGDPSCMDPPPQGNVPHVTPDQPFHGFSGFEEESYRIDMDDRTYCLSLEAF